MEGFKCFFFVVIDNEANIVLTLQDYPQREQGR